MTSHQIRAAPLLAEPSGIGLAPQYTALLDLVEQVSRSRGLEPNEASPSAVEPARPDEPLKLPSGWYVADAAPQVRWRPRPELRAAIYGLLAGVVVLLPVTVWLNASDASRVMAPQDDLATVANQLVADARAMRPPESPEAHDRLLAAALAPTDTMTIVDADLDEARRLVVTGDIVAARTLLATAAAATSPRALFLMAETFDPNMLAAWGTRGVTADPDRARALYAAANALGHDKADGRLDALK